MSHVTALMLQKRIWKFRSRNYFIQLYTHLTNDLEATFQIFILLSMHLMLSLWLDAAQGFIAEQMIWFNKWYSKKV